MKKLRPTVTFEYSENFWSSENMDYNDADLREFVKHIFCGFAFLNK